MPWKNIILLRFCTKHIGHNRAGIYSQVVVNLSMLTRGKPLWVVYIGGLRGSFFANLMVPHMIHCLNFFKTSD